MMNRLDSDDCLTAVARHLTVIRLAKLLDDPGLFSVRAMFAGLRAEGELILRGVR